MTSFATYALQYSVWIYCPVSGELIQVVFAAYDSAEKFARQLRDQINRDNKRGKEWSVTEVRVKDEMKNQWRTAYEVTQLEVSI